MFSPNPIIPAFPSCRLKYNIINKFKICDWRAQRRRTVFLVGGENTSFNRPPTPTYIDTPCLPNTHWLLSAPVYSKLYVPSNHHTPIPGGANRLALKHVLRRNHWTDGQNAFSTPPWSVWPIVGDEIIGIGSWALARPTCAPASNGRPNLLFILFVCYNNIINRRQATCIAVSRRWLRIYNLSRNIYSICIFFFFIRRCLF